MDALGCICCRTKGTCSFCVAFVRHALTKFHCRTNCESQPGCNITPLCCTCSTALSFLNIISCMWLPLAACLSWLQAGSPLAHLLLIIPNVQICSWNKRDAQTCNRHLEPPNMPRTITNKTVVPLFASQCNNQTKSAVD